MQEKWEKWEPISGLEKIYGIESIEYTINKGFQLTLFEWRDTEKRVSVIFKDGIFAHRQTDESFMINTIEAVSDNYESDLHGNWTFFKVTNSLYLKWLSEQSRGLSDEKGLTHFSFLTSDAVLDIVNDYEPTVEILD